DGNHPRASLQRNDQCLLQRDQKEETETPRTEEPRGHSLHRSVPPKRYRRPRPGNSLYDCHAHNRSPGGSATHHFSVRAGLTKDVPSCPVSILTALADPDAVIFQVSHWRPSW